MNTRTKPVSRRASTQIVVSLLLGSASLAAACAHQEPEQRKTLSTVGNEDVTGDPSDPDNKVMTYTEVSDEEALRHDELSSQKESAHASQD